MTEKEKYNKAISKIKKREITEIIILLRNTQSIQCLRILIFLECIVGNYLEAYKLVTKVLKVKEYEELIEIKKWIRENIKIYNEEFNKILISLKTGKNDKSILERIISLQNIANNSELIKLKIIYLYRNKRVEEARKELEELEKIDSSDTMIKNYQIYIGNKKNKNKTKLVFISLILTIALMGIVFLLTQKNKYLQKETQNFKNIIVDYKKNQELTVDKDKQEKDIRNFFSNNEIYNLALKRYKEEKYEEVIKFYENIKIKELPEYKAKELIFLVGISYEKMGLKKEAQELYSLFKKEYNKKEYEIYLKYIENKEKIWKEYTHIM